MSTLLAPPLLASVGPILLAIVGVGFLIFIHELGHYLACRLTGTRVETFSIGFGTRLFGWESLPGQPRQFTLGRRRLDPADHAMDFRVALVPLGGYVKMAGEEIGDLKTGAPDEFGMKPTWARVFIVSAGVIMNVILAAVLYFVAFANHVEESPAVVGQAVPGKAAWAAGLEPGDRLLALGGQRLRSFIDLKMQSVFLPRGVPAIAEIERGGERFEVSILPAYDAEAGAVLIGVRPATSLTIHDGETTLAIGATDRVEVAGIPVRGGSQAVLQLTEAWQALPDRPVEVRVPGGASVRVAFRPAEGAPEAPTWRVGIVPYGTAVVAGVRGEARRLFEKGDALLRAEGPGGEIPLQRATDVGRLAFHAPVDRIVLRRRGEEKILDLGLETPAAVAALLQDLYFESPKGLAVAPLRPGTLSPAADGQTWLRYPSSPAADAGLREGDRILKVDGEAVATWSEFLAQVKRRAGPDKLLEMLVRGNDDQERTLAVKPVALVPLAPGILESQRVLEPFETDGVLDAAGVAIQRTGREIVGIFRVIGAFFSGNLSFNKNVAGPVTIVRASASRSEQSFLAFLIFLAYISVTLAVMNILPIPILDGGWLVIILIEKVKGSPLSDATRGRLQTMGLMLLLVLMFFAFKNDFLNFSR